MLNKKRPRGLASVRHGFPALVGGASAGNSLKPTRPTQPDLTQGLFFELHRVR